ncbi:TPA: hypothetical protein ACQVKY_005622 [Serratia marcescens]|uniref:Uncharacterized protein n=1 Tax=Serratia nevei TaxID=2703794 RepID=A0ABT7G5G8_9GAMM|nr:hypothetical protein [Serratia nevei]HAU4290824.1 hypothetical protein [Serratia marcescens]MDK5168994.1 hypothetical protein [Serratia nevei]MDK5298488.1 hypothetical protein [Serratia nevei]MEC5887260.1 hypothetical protein [Serratia nevei]HAU4297522.1 hypothetical protein [Serratia marcescens]
MTPSELEYKLKNLPPNTPITAEHIIAILGALQAPQIISNQEGAYSSWDNDKLIDTDTLAEWIGEIPSRLKKWRVDGLGPKFISKAKHVAYRVGDVREWLKSRTVQSTTQADRLSFVSAFDNCLVAPTIYHDEQPYTLFESIELFGSNGEINITGFEVLITADPLAMSYLNGNLDDLLKTDDLNKPLSYFINGQAQGGTLAHLMAKTPAAGLNDYLPELLDSGLDFSRKDNEDKTALEYGNDHMNNYLEKRAMMLRFQSKFPKKNG